jgi:4-alpha-glucanotransferase
MATILVSFSHSDGYEQALTRAADLFGIEREYWDIFGHHHAASRDGIEAVLRSMGIATGSIEQLDKAIEEQLCEEWGRVTPATLVSSISDRSLLLHLPGEGAGTAEIEVRWEDGKIDRASLAFGIEPVGRAELCGRRFAAFRAEVPFEPRLGYHELRVSAPGAEPSVTRWIVCPDRAYFPEKLDGNGRAAGVSVSLYGVRSERNWGCGDFTDLCRLLDWAHTELHASFVGLNPLHAISNRQPYNTSPYLPVCTFYKNLIYLDVEAIPDFARSACTRAIVAGPRVQGQLRRLREAEFVEYEQVQRLKLRVLKALFRTFLRNDYRPNTPRALEFRKYVDTEGHALDTFATYCALDDAVHHAHPDVWLWTDWPEQYRTPDSEATRNFAREHWRSVLFFKYIQWQLDLQLGAAQRHARELGLAIGLYHDLALATDRFGADLWAHRRFYVAGCRVGAPPDDFSPNGQDWSFPPPNALEHYRDGYRLFADSIRKNVRHGGALRIDHVMRFFHLFWIPDQLEAKRGIYVRDRHMDLIRILALESVRNQVIIVGEDLGTVADEIRETLSRFGILSYRLFYFERRRDGSFKWPNEYPQQALVSASTHDLPTLTGFWEHRDIEARRAAGLFHDDSAYHAQIADRMREKQKILDVLFQTGTLPHHHPRRAVEVPQLTGDLHFAIVGFLASTPSALMLLGEEDLMKQPDQQNLPGTTAEYPNWRHKTRFKIEDLRTDRLAHDCTSMYRDWLGRTGRANSGS